MQRKTLMRCSLSLCVIGLLLVFSPLSGLGATMSGQPATGLTAGVTVEIISCPTTVAINEPITVRWRITGGAAVSQTRVDWGLQPGYYVEGSEAYYSGAPGEYQHTFSLPYATTTGLYIQAMAQVDGAEYRSLEKVVWVPCASSFTGNHDRAHAASIATNQSYTGCQGNESGDWYVVNIPACSSMHASADPAPGEIGGGQGVVLEVYDAAGVMVGNEYPDSCGGMYGRCDPVFFDKSFPEPGTIYLNVWGTGPSYELRVNTVQLSIESDDFLACNGPSEDCWWPWYWHWTDPLSDAETDRTNYGDAWWMSVPGGGTHDLHETTNAPRYTQSMCGDFAVQADVALGRTGSYQSAGLVVWQNEDNFMRWEVNDSGALRALRMRGGGWTDSGNLTYLPGNVRLHLQRVGQRIDCFAFVGGAWTHYRSWDLVAGPVEVGLFVVNVGAEGAASATFDYFRSVAPLALPITPTPTPGTPVAGFEWRAEAESGQLTAPMAVRASGDACGGQYVSSDGSNSGQASFSLTVPQAGNYTLWARVKGEEWTGNSFYVAWDSADPIHYEAPQFGGQWVYGWDRVHQVDQPENPFWLAAGSHTLRFGGREPNAALDAVLLTNDAGYVPSGCAVSGTATPTVTRTPTRTGTPMPPRVWLPLICKERPGS